MEQIQDLVPLSGIDMGLTGVVSLIVLLICFGLLVPKAVLKIVQAETERWRLAAETERASRERLQDALMGQSMEMAKMNLHSMEELEQLASENRTRASGRWRPATIDPSTVEPTEEEGG